IGVGHELDGRESLTHLANDVHIPAGLDFHFDALVAGGELTLYFFEKLRDRFLNADGNPARNFAPRAAADVLPERAIVQARFEVPYGCFQASAGHGMDANVAGEGRDVTGAR